MTDASLTNALLNAGARKLHLTSGTVIFRPGSECPGFVILHSGTIRVSLVSEGGRELVLYRVTPGQICLQTFACLAGGTTYSAEGVAESVVDGLLVPTSVFQDLVATLPAFRNTVFKAVAERFNEFEHVVETLAFTGLEARVASALWRLAGAGSTVTATHQEIATEIGSAREAVTRQLKALAQSGVISVGRGHIEIVNRAKLSQLATKPV